MPPTFHLLYERSFLGSVLASVFHRRFDAHSGYCGALVLGESPPASAADEKQVLHGVYGGRKDLNADELMYARSRYRDFNDTSEQIVKQFGFPSQSDFEPHRAKYIGARLEEAHDVALALSERGTEHYVFCFADQIFRGVWLRPPITLLNGHPGVLPFGRGVGALEQIAATGDRAWFGLAAGVTVHFITAEIDAGPIVRSQRLREPYSFDSLQQLRAFVFVLLFELMADVAEALPRDGRSVPVGVSPEGRNQYPCFRRRDRTTELKERAATTFLSMKRSS